MEIDVLIDEIRERGVKCKPVIGYKTKEQALKAAKKR